MACGQISMRFRLPTPLLILHTYTTFVSFPMPLQIQLNGSCKLISIWVIDIGFSRIRNRIEYVLSLRKCFVVNITDTYLYFLLE